MFVYLTRRRKENSLQAANAAEISQPKAKDPSHINVNMAESCEKTPRLKWPCVLQPLHVQSSTFNKNYLLGSSYMKQVPKFHFLNLKAKKRTLTYMLVRTNRILNNK